MLDEPENADRKDTWARSCVLLSLMIGAAVFTFQMHEFHALAYTSDLFVSVQLARSWLEGHFLTDNCFGPHLAFHTYFMLPILGLLAKPFGAPGLFFALALAVAACGVLSARILRLLGATGPQALVIMALLLVSPLAVETFLEPGGFHVELLEPALVLALFHQLLRRRMLGSIVFAVLVCSLKEDAPIAVFTVSSLVLIEDRLANRSAWHRPALVTILIAIVLLPLLLVVGQLQPRTSYTVNRFTLLQASSAGEIHNIRSLAIFVATNLHRWFAFAWGKSWLRLFVVGSFGMILLRPWALPLVALTTVVAWILGQSVMWPPRFVNTYSLLWCVTLLGAGTLLRWFFGRTPRFRRRALFAAVVLVALLVWQQLTFCVYARVPYALHSRTTFTQAERSQADALFACYRQEGKPSEPVVASPFLFRYAHDRDLYWLDRLQGRPRPLWILQDGTWPYTDFGLQPSEYSLIGKSGRFTLLKRKGTGAVSPGCVSSPRPR